LTRIGILAYGSIIRNPGNEIKSATKEKMKKFSKTIFDYGFQFISSSKFKVPFRVQLPKSSILKPIFLTRLPIDTINRLLS